MNQDVKIPYMWENIDNVVLDAPLDINFIATFVKFMFLFFLWILIELYNYIMIIFVKVN